MTCNDQQAIHVTTGSGQSSVFLERMVDGKRIGVNCDAEIWLATDSGCH